MTVEERESLSKAIFHVTGQEFCLNGSRKIDNEFRLNPVQLTLWIFNRKSSFMMSFER